MYFDILFFFIQTIVARYKFIYMKYLLTLLLARHLMFVRISLPISFCYTPFVILHSLCSETISSVNNFSKTIISLEIVGQCVHLFTKCYQPKSFSIFQIF